LKGLKRLDDDRGVNLEVERLFWTLFNGAVRIIIHHLNGPLKDPMACVTSERVFERSKSRPSEDMPSVFSDLLSSKKRIDAQIRGELSPILVGELAFEV
jgi:hypothetical protein